MKYTLINNKSKVLLMSNKKKELKDFVKSLQHNNDNVFFDYEKKKIKKYIELMENDFFVLSPIVLHIIKNFSINNLNDLSIIHLYRLREYIENNNYNMELLNKINDKIFERLM